MTNSDIILWQRIDMPGHEFAAISEQRDGWLVTGVAVLVYNDVPCRAEYEIHCDNKWTTRACIIRASLGAKYVHMEIKCDEESSWTVNGADAPALRGCSDIDLGFSPVTNLLPIRRLAIPVGAHADVRAAWVRFPEFTVEVLEQTYSHVDSSHYAYVSAGGAFRRMLTVNAFGSVVDYPGIWRAEATATDQV